MWFLLLQTINHQKAQNKPNSFSVDFKSHSRTVVTHSPPTSEVDISNPKHYVGKMVLS